MKRTIFLIGILVHSIISFSQILTLQVEANHFQIDHPRQLIVSHIENIDSYNNLSDYDELKILFDGEEFVFSTVPNQIKYSASYHLQKGTDEYTLYFTSLPIVSIVSDYEIPDEPKVLGYFSYSDEEQVVTSKIGVEIRGGVSQGYPKKNYDLEFWEDDAGESTHDVSFKELRTDDDWILRGSYNEPLRLRNYISSKLWLDMHELYYQDEEKKAKAGADLIYVELFLNESYNGIYTLSEQVDKKQLQLEKYKEEIRGELYKGVHWGDAVVFSGLPDYDNQDRAWGGYEMKYPKEKHITDWSLLYDFTSFVLYSSDRDFTSQIWEEFEYNNCSDYYIFLNLLRANDNTGKNVYVAKRKQDTPYFYVPWDLDGAFGTWWDGTNHEATNDILSNGLYDRLHELNPANYLNNLANKWFTYRNDLFKKDQLIERFQRQYDFLSSHKVYEREALVFPNYSFGEEDFSYLTHWIEDRVDFLDWFFDEFYSFDPLFTQTKPYPNPLQGNKIYFTNYIHLIGKKYKIYNILGHIVDEGRMHNNYIAVAQLKKGIYVLHIHNKKYKLIVR
ncbi:MAG: hypothetical protein CSA94_00380 [Bacteroidetes bacterium]|nr:MAG: hypothetical protein CSA94_00380 [Bacteroidota bacterium]